MQRRRVNTERKASSGIVLIFLLVSVLTLVFYIRHVRANGTIYIRADGSIDPPTAPIISSDKINYVFTSNISDSIVVERNNIIVDGSGYTIQGSGIGNGITVSRRISVTIKNMEIRTFTNGIYGEFTSYIKVIGNRIAANYDGICFWAADLYSNVTQNTFTSNSQGIEMVDTHFFSVSQNNITNNGDGIALRMSAGSILRNNIANNSIGIDQDSSGAAISENKITNNGHGIYISGPMASGSKINENKITNNSYGIYLYGDSYNNEITGNNITSNSDCGIYLYGMSAGGYPNRNTISTNIVTENNIGIRLGTYSINNAITGNNITKNYYGMQVNAMTSTSLIYHNNFANNTIQVQVNPPYPGDDYRYPTWDNGYPSGGNYWSNYNGADLYSGPYQNEAGSDGIGDTPYTIDGYNADKYPLINPFFQTPDFEIGVSPSTGTTAQATTVTTNVHVSAIAGYDYLVSLSASGQPEGVTINFNPNTRTPDFTSTMAIQVGDTVPANTYSITVTGLGSDGKTHSTTYTLTVTPPPVPEFPLGFVFEIAFIAVFMYLWYKRRHRTLR